MPRGECNSWGVCVQLWLGLPTAVPERLAVEGSFFVGFMAITWSPKNRILNLHAADVTSYIQGTCEEICKVLEIYELCPSSQSYRFRSAIDAFTSEFSGPPRVFWCISSSLDGRRTYWRGNGRPFLALTYVPISAWERTEFVNFVQGPVRNLRIQEFEFERRLDSLLFLTGDNPSDIIFRISKTQSLM